jgi:transposase
MEERRSYSKEFKLDAIELSNSSNKSVKEIAADLGIPYKLLCVWRSKYFKEGKESFPGHGNIHEKDKEFKQLEKELKNIKEERDILKKALAIFSKPQGRNTDL